jgi:hypothetical protein
MAECEGLIGERKMRRIVPEDNPHDIEEKHNINYVCLIELNNIVINLTLLTYYQELFHPVLWEAKLDEQLNRKAIICV